LFLLCCKPDHISFDSHQKKGGLQAPALPADFTTAKSADAWFNPDCVVLDFDS